MENKILNNVCIRVLKEEEFGMIGGGYLDLNTAFSDPAPAPVSPTHNYVTVEPIRPPTPAPPSPPPADSAEMRREYSRYWDYRNIHRSALYPWPMSYSEWLGRGGKD